MNCGQVAKPLGRCGKEMLNLKELKKAFNGKKVLMTGHTGFKGSYMCVLLKYLGAEVYGYSLKPEKGGLYSLLVEGVKKYYSSLTNDIVKGSAKNSTFNEKTSLVCDEIFADIRDEKKLTEYMKKVKPDYVIHMAAQPLVLLGYEKPQYTYDVNVMGTVNLMEAIRKTYCDEVGKANSKENKNHIQKNNIKKVVSILNVTTDKVYENNDLSDYAFKENDKLCGRDPYANSKSCSELVTYAYEKSYFSDKSIFRISTARAGNVIGGGDLNENRIIPDCYRAIKSKSDMLIRNPLSIRPYQYVLEPLIIYLNILAYQSKNKSYEGHYNIGPDKKSCLDTKTLVEKFYGAVKEYDNVYLPKVICNKVKQNKTKHEAAFLRLDNNLIKKTIGYKEIFTMNRTMYHTAKVYIDMLNKENIYTSILNIIKTF